MARWATGHSLRPIVPISKVCRPGWPHSSAKERRRPKRVRSSEPRFAANTPVGPAIRPPQFSPPLRKRIEVLSTEFVMTLAIETNQLTRFFDGFRAVDHVDLRVERGTFYGFLGP